MELFGQIIVYIMMAFLLLGAGAYIFKPGSPLARNSVRASHRSVRSSSRSAA
ncbi:MULTISPECIES: hypothetical protein [Gordonia]|uniref:Uncharacterized protein n=1 Tax=Gordonia amicalis TaxID=89053 RepID=A0AAE4R8W6_9ACTN|nr:MULTISPECIES: hypothetical protein [Gordonia]KAF0967627.1 hypothetical protein BPODLACK_03796 [Gordonia sp. YY1]MDJ0454626.1 hypothetical protein [Gordonia amicalis]MDV6310243.1 hypothetical protein [Gordonia amicalis]MDV6314706.1 hypothetical protein [Gordonia amicalis]MDV7078025.1 hypothetical protein [Gordonia amicalis]